MRKVLSDEGLDLIFRGARTHSVWLDKPVDDALLRQVYDLAKIGPTSANMSPMRIVFVKSREAKERLKPALDAGNVDKTMKAPRRPPSACSTWPHDRMDVMERTALVRPFLAVRWATSREGSDANPNEALAGVVRRCRRRRGGRMRRVGDP
jgi:nitroreductase